MIKKILLQYLTPVNNEKWNTKSQMTPLHWNIKLVLDALLTTLILSVLSSGSPNSCDNLLLRFLFIYCIGIGNIAVYKDVENISLFSNRLLFLMYFELICTILMYSMPEFVSAIGNLSHNSYLHFWETILINFVLPGVENVLKFQI